MNTEELIQKIESKGYWRVVIRPTVFEEKRIKTFSDARKLVDSNKVSFGGWDYPFYDDNDVTIIENYIEGSVDWRHHMEYWRFFRSGQFLHLMALYEDHIDLDGILPISYPPRPARTGYLSILNVTHTVTEIFEFAARLGSKGALEPSVQISVQLHNLDDHQLANFDKLSMFPDRYVRSSKAAIVYEVETTVQELISNSDDLALDGIVGIYESFNWINPGREPIAEDQRKLRERRI